jgi:hypothetical protein
MLTAIRMTRCNADATYVGGTVGAARITRRFAMKKMLGFLTTLGLGAGLAYLLDPQQGGRRRALVRDKAMSARKQLGDTLDGKSRHWRNRAQGLIHDARGMFGGSRERRDDVDRMA